MKKILIASLLLALTITSYSGGQGGNGKVVAYKGKVYILQYQKGYKQIRVTKNIKIYPKDIVLTKRASVVKIRLADGSHVTIKPNSRVQFSYVSKKSQRISLGRGGLLSKVNKLRSKKGFAVNTPSSLAGVRGTKFVVEYDENAKQNKIDVYEGQVNLNHDVVTTKKTSLKVGNRRFNGKTRVINRRKSALKKGNAITYGNRGRSKKRTANTKLLKTYESMIEDEAIEVSGWEYN